MNTEKPRDRKPSGRKAGLARRVQKDASFAGRTAGEMFVGAIPVLGGAVGAALTALELQAISIRLENYFEELSDLVQHIDEAKVRHEYLRTPEFGDIVIAAVEAARRTSNRAKLRMIASILLGAATIDAPEDLDVEAVLTRIRDLSPGELYVARVVLKNSGPGTRGAFAPGGADGDFQLAHLEASGLITPVNQGAPMGGQRFSGQHAPTATFRRVMAVMEAGGWKEEDGPD